ncbi:sugar phosphate isomerase/epimerase family protein [Halomonas sp. V046]|uniref:sugar phosphate isomerase/epimerase family protein n=1 Tax=Halomonas sp. V046 TaxID=3459611 RepID=UPI0040445CDD
MHLAIDAYCFHRFFAEVYPGLEQAPARSMSLDDVIDKAVAFDVEGVSLESFMLDDDSPSRLAAIRARLDAAGLERAWAWGHPDGLGSGARPEALDDLIQHIDIAATLGADVMRICAGGRRTRPAEWSSHRAALLPLLRRAADYGAERGITLAIENHVDLLTDELVELLETLDHSHLGACLDTGNNLRMLEDPWHAIERLAPWARATHVKDIQAHRGDPRTFGFWPSVPLGRGLIDIPGVIRELGRHAYQGLLALEIDYLHPDYRDAQGSEDDAIAESLAYLRRLRDA